MQKAGIKIGEEYVLRDPRKPDTPVQRVRILQHVRGKKWKAEWIEPNPGLTDYVEAKDILVHWKDRKPFLRDEQSERQLRLLQDEEDQLLTDLLDATDVAHSRFARSFAAGRVQSRGREWVEAKLGGVASGWPVGQRAELLVCLPFDGRTWDVAEASGPETDQRYWRLVRPWVTDGDVERAVRKLLQHHRPNTVIGLLGAAAGRGGAVPVALLADALERALEIGPDDDPPFGPFAYHVSELLDALIESGEIEERSIAALEWGFLPVLEQHERTPRLLHRELGRNPDFFVELVALAFRADDEEPRELSAEEQARARNAYDLLDSWRVIPGASDNGIDAASLAEWVGRARAANAANGRGAIGDDRIGHVLSGSPAGPDGAWPHPAVRAVIEGTMSAELEDGIEVGLFNSRGVVTKHPGEGGAQEHHLADQYAGFAAALADGWPRTAAMLRRIAAGYRVEARREDQEAELREDLGR